MNPPEHRAIWWAVPASCFLILVTLAMLLGSPEHAPEKGTSYDASRDGFRAAYLLLERLGYPVARIKRPLGTSVRWVLFPKPSRDDPVLLKEWLRRGGILVLADNSPKLAGQLGLDVRIVEGEAYEASPSPPTPLPEGEGSTVQVLSEMQHIDGGSTRVEGPEDFDRAWVGPDNQPLVSIYRQGRGELWLLNRPRFLTNGLISHGDNALLLSRLADSLSARPEAVLAFDEYVHGLRDRPSVLELLATPPTLWVAIQVALVIGLIVWHAAPRFGAIRTSPPARRRSKEEFLDAMASLLERCEDYDDAWQSVRAEFSADLAQALGLPADTPLDQVAEEAHRRGRIDQSALKQLTAMSRRPDRQTFPAQLTQLETIRDEFFSRRSRG